MLLGAAGLPRWAEGAPGHLEPVPTVVAQAGVAAAGRRGVPLVLKVRARVRSGSFRLRGQKAGPWEPARGVMRDHASLHAARVTVLTGRRPRALGVRSWLGCVSMLAGCHAQRVIMMSTRRVTNPKPERAALRQPLPTRTRGASLGVDSVCPSLRRIPEFLKPATPRTPNVGQRHMLLSAPDLARLSTNSRIERVKGSGTAKWSSSLSCVLLFC